MHKPMGILLGIALLAAPLAALCRDPETTRLLRDGGEGFVAGGYAIRWTRGGEKQIEGIKRSRDARERRRRVQLCKLDGRVHARGH